MSHAGFAADSSTTPALRVPSPAGLKLRRLALPLLLLATIIGVSVWWSQRLPKRFATVVEGRLYRSGEVSPRQLETIAREFGVTRVLSLLDPDVPESIAERQAAERLGIEWLNVPLRGNGASTPEQREVIRSILFDPDAGPTLVHCAAGVNRTGLAVGMYRLHCEGWTIDEVFREMDRFDFEDLPKHENLRAALREQAEAVGKN